MQNRYSEAIQTLQKLGDWIRFCTSELNRADVFFGHGTTNAWDESLQLVLHALRLPFDVDQRVFSTRLLESERATIAALLEGRVVSRKPLPYLTHEAWFMGLSFYVDERVLVPRSAMAEWIEKRFEPFIEEPPLTVLDLCTGSACIAIAAAHVFPEASFDAVDISHEALEVAAKNVADYGLENRVQLIQSDLFAKLPKQPYDLILCNPPYVSAEEMEVLPAEYRHEPELALFAEEQGVEIVRRILADVGDYLSAEGFLVLDVGDTEAAICAAFPDIPFTALELTRGGSGILMVSARELAMQDN